MLCLLTCLRGARGEGGGVGNLQSLQLKTLAGPGNASTSLHRRPSPKPLSDEERERREPIDDELKDSRNFVDFPAPRPLRRVIFAFGAVSCFIGFLISASQLQLRVYCFVGFLIVYCFVGFLISASQLQLRVYEQAHKSKFLGASRLQQ